jgi:putative transposase
MILSHQESLGVRVLCEALSEPRSSWYRSLKPRREVSPAPRSPRRLTDAEELQILDILDSERFLDMAPGEIHATLLDEGVYLCSERTMYRILSTHGQNVIRRQSAPRIYAKPELLATRPNELWSWDITKLKGPVKWTYFYLYKVLDVFSRYVVGWIVATRESADLAKDLIAEVCRKQMILPGALTIHADNGGPMKSSTFSQLLTDLGVAKSNSRPSVSNDNPFSESAFKTLKYRPGYPERFGSIEDARSFCRTFFTWYNTQHRHSGIAMLTPEHVHYNSHQDVLNARSSTLLKAYQIHPERFVKGVPKIQKVPTAVWINKPISKEQEPCPVS